MPLSRDPPPPPWMHCSRDLLPCPETLPGPLGLYNDRPQWSPSYVSQFFSVRKLRCNEWVLLDLLLQNLYLCLQTKRVEMRHVFLSIFLVSSHKSTSCDWQFGTVDRLHRYIILFSVYLQQNSKYLFKYSFCFKF